MSYFISDDVNRIMMELDAMEKPFSEYILSMEEGRPVRLGKGSSAIVFQVEKRKKREEKFALKVVGFEDETDRQYLDFFHSITKIQSEMGSIRGVVSVLDREELFLNLDEDDRVLEAEKWEEMLKGESTCVLQFTLMEKLEPVVRRNKEGEAVFFPFELSGGNQDEILRLTYDVATALDVLHKKKIMHRDVKLENIFYSEKGGEYKLGDFGAARSDKMEIGCLSAYTMGYGAPEVVCGSPDKYDYTADIYSLGITLFLLLNEGCFPGSDGYHVRDDVQYTGGYLPPRPKYGTDELCAIVDKMCRYNPDERYQSMEEVLEDFRAILWDKQSGYDKSHARVTFTVGSALLFLGTVICSIADTRAQKEEFAVSLPILLVLTTIKFERHLFYEKTGILTFLQMLSGGFYLFKTGLSWAGVLCLIMMLCSSGDLGFVLAGSIAAWKIPLFMKELIKIEARDFWTYRWAGSACVAVAITLLLKFFLYTPTGWETKKYLKMAKWYPYLMTYVFFTFVLTGIVFKVDAAGMTYLFGLEKYHFIRQLELLPMGIAGTLFSLLWIIREKIMIHIKSKV